jgi:hypothetical protein
MSAAVHMQMQQQQQATLRGAPGDSKPYSLFMISPERVLGLKRAAEVSQMPINYLRFNALFFFSETMIKKTYDTLTPIPSPPILPW